MTRSWAATTRSSATGPVRELALEALEALFVTVPHPDGGRHTQK